jgi:hypothetical protein
MIKLPDQFNFDLHSFNIILVWAAVCLIGTATFGRGRKLSYPEEVASSTSETFLFMYPSCFSYNPILTAMKPSNINSLLISKRHLPKNCDYSQKRISHTSSRNGALQRCDTMNAAFHVCYSRFIFHCPTAAVGQGLHTVDISRSHTTKQHSR